MLQLRLAIVVFNTRTFFGLVPYVSSSRMNLAACRITLLTILSLLTVLHAKGQDQAVDAVDFSDESGVLYVPAHRLAEAMGEPVEWKGKQLLLDGSRVEHWRTLYDGTKLIPLQELKRRQWEVVWDPVLEIASVQKGARKFSIKRGVKRVQVNKHVQELRAYQGNILIFESHVSTGRKGHTTPSGEFAVGSKEAIHYSSLYDDAPMPWAVQVDGNVFIHGFTSVPRYPASHGCIRVPLRGRNPARWFYHWVDKGTPVSVSEEWPESTKWSLK